MLQCDLMILRHGGRACLLPVAWEGPTDEGRLAGIRDSYFRIVRELERVWKEKGDTPDFFGRYYRPKVEELTRGLVPAQEGVTRLRP